MKKNNILLICCCSAIAVILIVAIILSSYSSNTNKISLGQYLGVEVSFSQTVITDEDVENTLIDAITADQENVNIKNRAVRKGDTVNMDYSGKVDGVAFDGGTDTGYDLLIGGGKFIDGFEDQIIGMKVGTSADIKVTFPDPYDDEPSLSGVEAVFSVKINSISGKDIPSKITDAMVKELTEDTYSTVVDYREAIRLELEDEAEYYNAQSKQEAVWNAILNNCTVEKLSKTKISYYSDYFESYYKDSADMYGMELIDFIESAMGITKEEFDAYKKYYAESQVTNYAVAEAIAKKEGISINNDEYKAYVNENGITSEQEKQYGEIIMDELLFQKVLEYVTSKAKITIL